MSNGQRPSRSRLDPAVDMMKRIERLERRDAHPDSVVGLTTSDIGSVEPTGTQREGHGWYAVTEVITARISADPDIMLDTGAFT